VHNKRAHKGVVFIDLRDITGIMQVVVTSGTAEAYELASNLNLESYITISGTLQEKPAKKGADETIKDFELLGDGLIVESPSLEQLPIPVLDKADNEADLDLRLDWRFLDLRRPENQLIFKVWTELEKGAREFFSKNSFLQIYTPTFMNTASETGADVFEVKYFDRKAYLAQSPQFYKQMAIASGLDRVFMVGAVYRAEKSFTSRHVTEFTGWDFEVSGITDLDQIMSLEEEMLVAGFTAVKNNTEVDIEIPSAPFPRISLSEAKEKLKLAGIKSEADDDVSPEEERGICEIIKKETGSDFVFVTDWPISVRPFYHMRKDDDNNITKSFDLLYKGIEITTGAIREHRIEILEKQAEEKGMDLSDLSDYLNFFRYGMPSHGGVGIGPARIVMKLLNLNNIKEAIFLPRDVKRLRP
jgi:aspartyl-tRNA synthetase